MATATGSGDFDIDISLATAEQSCKECRRRKAKCDRAVPTCGLCGQYRRHCLYEKHSRTPLTRKHLTEVEERLERAESLIKRLKRNDEDTGHAIHDTSSASSRPLPMSHSTPGLGLCEIDPEIISTNAGGNGLPVSSSPLQGAPAVAPPVRPIRSPDVHRARVGESDSLHQIGTTHKDHNQPQKGEDIQSNDKLKPPKSSTLAESPPQDDFEWDEQDSLQRVDNAPSGNEEDTHDVELVSDGMASLPVSEKEAGYLGIASGAALLRIMEPKRLRRDSRSRLYQTSLSCANPGICSGPNPNSHITEAMIDAYFRQYHLSYPIIHEATFRAQYSEVIPQPNGKCWQILAYTIAAIGVYTSSDTLSSNIDLELFAHARSMLSFDHLELGNLTLVQALTLISNYQQKRDKPNSGYNYLGLAVRMATGLGLHKEFAGWKISPLQMEIRRRVWWSLCVFDVGATITFSRPTVWPHEGVEVAFPMNVTDRDLTANSKTYPKHRDSVTPYTSVRSQAKFHVATNRIYSRVISKPLPTAEELISLDAELLEPWIAQVPEWFREDSVVEARYSLAHAVMQWRYRNFRIIMYRPFVIRMVLASRNDQSTHNASDADLRAYIQCLEDARITIESISKYWAKNEHNRLAAWYALYFLFQAALIPCICLRSLPLSPKAPNWCEQVFLTLRTIRALAPVNASCSSCYNVIMDLCGRYLNSNSHDVPATSDVGNGNGIAFEHLHDMNTNPSRTRGCDENQQHQLYRPIYDSPQTQINQVFPMMWPNVNALEAVGEVLGNDAWLSFLEAP